MKKREKFEALEGKNVANATLSLPPDLLEWIDAQATTDRRTRSQWVALELEKLKKEQASGGADAGALPVPYAKKANPTGKPPVRGVSGGAASLGQSSRKKS